MTKEERERLFAALDRVMRSIEKNCDKYAHHQAIDVKRVAELAIVGEKVRALSEEINGQ